MRVLVSGANGLLGQKLVAILAKDPEISLYATGLGPNRNTGENFRYLQMDITSRASVKEAFKEVRPEAVINTAAMTNVDICETERDNCWKLNVEAVKTLVEFCEGCNTFLTHLSTDFIFDGKNGPYLEDAEPNPLSFYGESKLASEKIIRDSKIDWAIARTVLVYGISNDPSRSNIVLWVKGKLEKGETIKIVNDQWRTPTLAEDLAKGCMLMTLQRATGVFNISGDELMTPYDIAIKTADYFNLDKSLIQEVDGSIFTQIAARPAKTGFILDKAKRTLGFKPHTFYQGLGLLASQLSE